MLSVERDVLRHNTKAFIKADPTQITLQRYTFVDDGAGGKIPSGDTDVGPYEVALVATTMQLPIRRTVEGAEVQPEYIIVAEWDADIQRGDKFTHHGVVFEVVFIHWETKEWETRAEVGYRG